MSFQGAAAYFTESEGVSLEAIEDNHTEEIESLEASFQVDDQQLTDQLRSVAYEDESASGKTVTTSPSSSKIAPPVGHDSDMDYNLKRASEHVIPWLIKYIYRLWQQFKQFCMEIGKAKTIDEAKHLPSNISADYRKWIALWIMDKCDENDIHTGKPKLLTVPHATYNNAQKMQAAISHKFGCDYGLGTQPWMENPAYPGRFIGNPSLSVVVSQYMISLQHRKVHVGETVTSACAMDEPTLKALWRKAKHPEDWGGFLIRMMLYLLYLVSFLYLLHFDEALRITWSDVTFQVKDPLLKDHWIDATPNLLHQGFQVH
ncbi:hypothetical protein EDD22DRAFT_950628 [Suillus occidentalis]|nr:hypothetical protein EDD22DRAFT_950628 [Suillus occidentalis]